MSDFTSGFWSWYIILPTLAGIAALFLFNYWMTGPKRPPGEESEPVGHVWDEDLEELNNPLPRWWLNLFYFTLVFGLGYLVLYPGLGNLAGTLGWTQVDQYNQEVEAWHKRYDPLFEKYHAQDFTVLVADREALKTGARLFANYCTTCHGSDARGAPGFPNLRDNDWLYGGDPVTIETSILHGRTGAMPAWGATLGPDAAARMTQYVLSLSGRGSAPGDGAEKFQQLCAACHGPEGKGNAALGAPNLTDDVWLYGGSPEVVRASIENGRQGRMPAHAEFLGEAKIDLLAAYVYSLSRPSPPAADP